MLVVKNPSANAGDIRDASSAPGGGYDNPLRGSCLENPMGRGAWQATVHGVIESQTRLSNLTCTHPGSHFLFLLNVVMWLTFVPTIWGSRLGLGMGDPYPWPSDLKTELLPKGGSPPFSPLSVLSRAQSLVMSTRGKSWGPWKAVASLVQESVIQRLCVSYKATGQFHCCRDGPQTKPTLEKGLRVASQWLFRD